MNPKRQQSRQIDPTFFTIGSTKEKCQHSRNADANQRMNSPIIRSVEFKDSRVVRGTTFSKILKTKMLPSVETGAKGFFTIGSTKEEVLNSSRNPDATEGMNSANYSSVEFKDSRVVSWNDISKILKTKMLPTTGVSAKGFFTIDRPRARFFGSRNANTNQRDTWLTIIRALSLKMVVVSWNDISKNP